MDIMSLVRMAKAKKAEEQEQEAAVEEVVEAEKDSTEEDPKEASILAFLRVIKPQFESFDKAFEHFAGDGAEDLTKPDEFGVAAKALGFQGDTTALFQSLGGVTGRRVTWYQWKRALQSAELLQEAKEEDVRKASNSSRRPIVAAAAKAADTSPRPKAKRRNTAPPLVPGSVTPKGSGASQCSTRASTPGSNRSDGTPTSKRTDEERASTPKGARPGRASTPKGSASSRSEEPAEMRRKASNTSRASNTSKASKGTKGQDVDPLADRLASKNSKADSELAPRPRSSSRKSATKARGG